MNTFFNIIASVFLALLAIFAIYYVIYNNSINDEYQTPIVIAIATICSQLIIIFIKPSVEIFASKNSKTYGVIYDKKFIVYHKLYDEIFIAKREIIAHLNFKANGNLEKNAYNSISNLQTSILLNRLLIPEKLYEPLSEMRLKFYSIYTDIAEYNMQLIISKKPTDEIIAKLHAHVTYLNSSKIFNSEILKIEKLMKKDLRIT